MVPADLNYGGRADSGVGAVPQDREQLHTAVLVAPSKERRRLRRPRRSRSGRSGAPWSIYRGWASRVLPGS